MKIKEIKPGNFFISKTNIIHSVGKNDPVIKINDIVLCLEIKRVNVIVLNKNNKIKLDRMVVMTYFELLN